MLNLFITGVEQIFLAWGATDFRKQADSLAAIVSMQFHLDPFAHHYVFIFSVTDLFRDAKGATTADEAEEILSRSGYHAVSDGVNAVIDIESYQMFWNVSYNSIEIGIMDRYK